MIHAQTPSQNSLTGILMDYSLWLVLLEELNAADARYGPHFLHLRHEDLLIDRITNSPTQCELDGDAQLVVSAECGLREVPHDLYDKARKRLLVYFDRLALDASTLLISAEGKFLKRLTSGDNFCLVG